MSQYPGLGMPLADLEQCDAVLLIGSNLQKEQPLAALRLRKAGLKGAAILAVNPVNYAFNFKLAAKQIVSPQQMTKTLAAILKALESPSDQHDAEIKQIAQHLQGKQKLHVMLGALALHHSQASLIRHFAQKIAAHCGATVSLMTSGANTAGAWLAGAIPHRHAGGSDINHAGLNANEMLHKPRHAYVLLNVEPDKDLANAHQANEAFKQAKFIVALSMYRNPVLEAYADVILPVAPFTETSGTYVNAAGEWQSFTGVASAFAASRPAWKVLRVLGNFLHLDGFDYESSEAVKHEVKTLVENMTAVTRQAYQPNELPNTQIKLTRIGEVPIYAVDGLVRRSQPLQDAQAIMEGNSAVVKLHPETAAKLNLHDDDVVRVKQHAGSAQLAVKVDDRIAVDAAWIAAGIEATKELGDLFGEVEIERV